MAIEINFPRSASIDSANSSILLRDCKAGVSSLVMSYRKKDRTDEKLNFIFPAS